MTTARAFGTSSAAPLRRSAPLGAALLALALLFLPACQRREELARRHARVAPNATSPALTATRYQDLVADQERYGGGIDPATGIHTCRDESRYSFVLEAGRSRTMTTTLGGPSSLIVGGCAEGSGDGPRGELVVRVRLPNHRWIEDRVVLGPGSGDPAASAWSERRLELDTGGGEARVELTARLPTGARAFVDTLAVRTEAKVGPVPVLRRVLLVSLDAFREDAIGAVGGRTNTPVLDRLLAESERVSPHWSQEISTLPSHASMLTGLPVELHGVDRDQHPLGAEVATLAERLAARRPDGTAGASTGAFLQIAPYLAEKFGLNQGFETYRLMAWTVPQELRLAADWASAHRDSDSFLFVHLYGAHSDFGTLPYEAVGATRSMIAERFGVADYGCREGHCASRLLLAVNFGLVPRIEADPEINRWLYDRGVETLDRQLGRFFEDLRAAGLWDDTLVLLTADHGEAFGEHGYFLHVTPHEETLRVPLLVKWPRGTAAAARAGGSTERFSTALDLAPTILAHFGLPADDLPGHDLARPPGRDARLMLSKDAVRFDDLKLVDATPEFPRALYDLAHDPAERANLLPVREADAARLDKLRRLALEAWSRRSGATASTETAPFTPEELELLRSLGYL